MMLNISEHQNRKKYEICSKVSAVVLGRPRPEINSIDNGFQSKVRNSDSSSPYAN